MNVRAVGFGGLLLAGLAIAGAPPLEAQVLKRSTTSRQFHGEVRLNAKVEFGGGTLQVAAGTPGSLYAMQLEYDAERFKPVTQWEAGTSSVTLGVESTEGGSIGVSGSGTKQAASIQLSPQADLNLSLALGAAVSMLDLGGLRLSSLSLETGASKTEVRFSTPNPMRCTLAAFRAGVAELTVTGLGNSRCDRVTFVGGMGSVVLDYTGGWTGNAALEATLAVGGLTLRIPRSVGVRITTEQFLASFQPAGFTRQGNRYLSANDATAAHHLEVTLTTSLGSVGVEWVD